MGTVRSLLGPTIRSSPWGQLAVAGGTATVLVLLTTANPDHTAGMVVERMRLAAVLLAIGAAGAMDDPTRPHLDACPVRLALRQSLRIAVVLAATAIGWLLVVLSAGFQPRTWRSGVRASELPVGALTVVLVALIALGVAVAAVVTRRRTGSAVVPAAGVVVAVAAVSAAWAPLRAWMWPPYRGAAWSVDDQVVDALWRGAHLRWAVVAIVATAVVAWGLRDPWRPDGTARAREATREGTTP